MKNVIVTGASRGIGYQISSLLAENGHRVYAVARSESKLKALASRSDNIIPIVADLTSETGQKVVSGVIVEINQIDILINNAAKLDNVSFMNSSIQDWKQLFDVNLFSVIQLIQLCIPKMISGGHIVNIGSMGGVQGSKKFSGLSAYSSSKGALAILTECLALEFASVQISVNCLALGAVSTEMQKEAFPDFEAPVTASEMGKFISDFALNGHTFINGKILPISFSDPE